MISRMYAWAKESLARALRIKALSTVHEAALSMARSSEVGSASKLPESEWVDLACRRASRVVGWQRLSASSNW